MKNNTFYDNISMEYDEMINFNKLIVSRKEILSKYINKNLKNAIDIGCGTGVDSIALAMNGLKVTGYDPSEKMIIRARENAKKLNQKIKFVNSIFKVGKSDKSKADIVVSLGNAFANIKKNDLQETIGNVYKSLKNDGVFLFQVLNYDIIRKKKNRIVNITESKDIIFTRFYDILPEEICFNILTVKKNNLKEYNFIATVIYEHDKDYLFKVLKQIGFRSIKIYGDFKGNRFSKRKSKDLIIFAKK